MMMTSVYSIELDGAHIQTREDFFRELRAATGIDHEFDQTDPMTIDEKAVELVRLIGQSTEYQAVKRANDVLGESGSAFKDLANYINAKDYEDDKFKKGDELRSRITDLLGVPA